MSQSIERSTGPLAWDSLAIWALLLLVIYGLRDVFVIAFLTFILSYLIRSIVVFLARRLRPIGDRARLERWLTLGTFVAIAAVLWAIVHVVGPQFVLQGRVLMAAAHRQDPEQALNHLLGRTVGAYLYSQAYGDPQDPRYQAALQQFVADGRSGEGAFAEFGRLESRLRSRFEIDYEAAEQQRLRDQVLHGGADSRRFAEWFLSVKAPALVAPHRAAYLARWQAAQPDTAPSTPADPKELERHLGELALADIRARPDELKPLLTEWEAAESDAEWRRLQSSPAYLQAFRDWFERQRAEDDTIPYDFETYVALSDAYPEGMAAFNQVYQARVAESGGDELLRSDFKRATEIDLARKWWSSSAAAASIREHLQQDPAQAVAAVASRVEGWMSSLIAVPAEVATALLLTILITFDMARLKQGAQGLRETRVGPLYDKVVPNLVAVARLIGRSFAAQGLIAVFNTLLTLALMRLLGLHNELLLGAIVFIASFIPVLGIIFSGIPIALQALLQPDGSLLLALYAVLGIGAIHAIESMVLSPRIVGHILHLHPVLVMAVLIVGEHLFGVWGLLLGVPISVYIIHVAVLADGIPGVYEPSGSDQATQ